MKALVGAFNQEKALIGAFSVIVKTDGSIAALVTILVTRHAEMPRYSTPAPVTTPTPTLGEGGW